MYSHISLADVSGWEKGGKESSGVGIPLLIILDYFKNASTDP